MSAAFFLPNLANPYVLLGVILGESSPDLSIRRPRGDYWQRSQSGPTPMYRSAISFVKVDPDRARGTK